MDNGDLILSISVKILKNINNPFRQNSYSKVDIRRALLRGKTRSDFIEEENRDYLTNAYHIQRIAYFVKNGWNDPISIDVGVPALGFAPFWIINDGNHRFAAAIYRDDPRITTVCAGSISLLKELLEPFLIIQGNLI